MYSKVLSWRYCISFASSKARRRRKLLYGGSLLLHYGRCFCFYVPYILDLLSLHQVLTAARRILGLHCSPREPFGLGQGKRKKGMEGTQFDLFFRLPPVCQTLSPRKETRQIWAEAGCTCTWHEHGTEASWLACPDLAFSVLGASAAVQKR